MNYDKISLQLQDERVPKDRILNGGNICSDNICLTYTLLSDDITKGEKDDFTPYKDRVGEFTAVDGYYLNADTGAILNVEKIEDYICFTLDCDNGELSQWGLAFPFNFQGKKNGGRFFEQFLFNSVYVTNDRKYKSFYLTKPNGANILVAVIGDADGWKMDYAPFQGGQYFWNFKIFGNFDKAYGKFERKTRLKVVICPVKDYDEALIRLSKLNGAPFIYTDLNGGKFGSVIKLKRYGACDKIIELYKGKEKELDSVEEYVIDKDGCVELVPYANGVKGAGITLYGYADLVDLYIKTMDAVDVEENNRVTDANLCEWQCWAPATLRLLLKYKDRLSDTQIKEYERRLRWLYKQVMETDPKKATPRLTILKQPYEDFPAYNIFKSRRIQEQFFGTTLFLDSYKYFKEEIFLEYAIGSMDSLLDNYQKEDGRLETNWSTENEEYTTVCAPNIPIIDMAIFLKDKDKKRSDRYFDSAKRICQRLINRGMFFPSEGGVEGEISVPDFLPDGSVSNTILNVLYYCKNVECKSEFLSFAKQVMDLHDNYVMKTPICQMQGSTLRWWENLWEADEDGPSLDCGHAWTIWRAESDWLYYCLTGDDKYRIKALNGFGTNYAKIDEQGNSYSLYNVDDINGGGFERNRHKVKFRLAPKFPDMKDWGLSRYVWIRSSEYFL